jgi:hypothetical protein
MVLDCLDFLFGRRIVAARLSASLPHGCFSTLLAPKDLTAVA